MIEEIDSIYLKKITMKTIYKICGFLLIIEMFAMLYGHEPSKITVFVGLFNSAMFLFDVLVPRWTLKEINQ